MFTKTELKAFRQDFASAVKDIEKKYGLNSITIKKYIVK